MRVSLDICYNNKVLGILEKNLLNTSVQFTVILSVVTEPVCRFVRIPSQNVYAVGLSILRFVALLLQLYIVNGKFLEIVFAFDDTT